MDVFDLDRTLVDDYSRFARSSPKSAPRISETKSTDLCEPAPWPEPPDHHQPAFRAGRLGRGARRRRIAPSRCGSRLPGRWAVDHPLPASDAIGRESDCPADFAVTTGTGSGKSLCFFIPIINAAIRARASGEDERAAGLAARRCISRCGPLGSASVGGTVAPARGRVSGWRYRKFEGNL